MGGVVRVRLVGGAADGRVLEMDAERARPWVFVTLDGGELRTTFQHPLTMTPRPTARWHRYQLDPRREDLRERPPEPQEVPVFVAL